MYLPPSLSKQQKTNYSTFQLSIPSLLRNQQLMEVHMDGVEANLQANANQLQLLLTHFGIG